MLEVFALIKRDGAGSQRGACARVWILRHAQTSPTNPARKTKAVQPFRIIVVNTRGDTRPLPRGQRQLTTIQLFENRLQTFRAFEAMFHIGALPREEKAI